MKLVITTEIEISEIENFDHAAEWFQAAIRAALGTREGVRVTTLVD
jgi:hypothetical protein